MITFICIYVGKIEINILQIEKWQQGDFGYCPRVYCENQPMLPVGKEYFISDGWPTVQF